MLGCGRFSRRHDLNFSSSHSSPLSGDRRQVLCFRKLHECNIDTHFKIDSDELDINGSCEEKKEYRCWTTTGEVVAAHHRDKRYNLKHPTRYGERIWTFVHLT